MGEEGFCCQISKVSKQQNNSSLSVSKRLAFIQKKNTHFMSSKPNASKNKKRLFFYEIVVDTKTTQIETFTYKSSLNLPLYSLVEVDFRKRRLLGLILKKVSKPNFPLHKIKPIKKVVDFSPLLSQKQVRLATIAKEYYLTSLGKIIFWGLPQIARRLTAKEPVTNLPPIRKGNYSSHLFYQADEWQREKIFSRVIERELPKGQVLLLSPNLNHWLPKRLAKRFKGTLLHNPTRTQEYQAWRQARQARTGLFVGAQKAVFLPFSNLRLILVDDPAHPGFKQDQDPKIHTVSLAKWLGQILKTKVILAGLLPDPKTYLEIKTGQTKFKKILTAPPIHLVDLNQENKLIGFHTEQAIRRALNRKEKTIIFHNRLGFARLFLCQECGFSAYSQGSTLPPALCPICQSQRIRMHSFGLERIKYDLKQLFPQASIRSATREESTKQGDILIATSAGLNIEKKFDLSVINLLEIGLALPDPMMAYKTLHFAFSALAKGKKKILQTFVPDHYLTTSVLHFDFEWFYGHWLRLRKKLKLSPFYREIKIEFKRKNKKPQIMAQLKKLPEVRAIYEIADQNGEHLLISAKQMAPNLQKILQSPNLKIEVDPL